MTNILQFDIITPALREGIKKVPERNAIANLENDTEKREKGLERRCEEPGNRGASRGEGSAKSKISQSAKPTDLDESKIRTNRLNSQIRRVKRRSGGKKAEALASRRE